MASNQRDPASAEPLYRPDLYCNKVHLPQMTQVLTQANAADDDRFIVRNTVVSSPQLQGTIQNQQAICQLERPPPDLTLPAVLACLCCCWPVGIAAIIYALKAYSAARTGDYEKARRNNGYATAAIAITVVLGAGLIVLSIILQLLRHSLYN